MPVDGPRPSSWERIALIRQGADLRMPIVAGWLPATSAVDDLLDPIWQHAGAGEELLVIVRSHGARLSDEVRLPSEVIDQLMAAAFAQFVA
ncbi:MULTISPECIES: hypothetical protein [Streptosporangiaceae]|uniref:hypothetical protein n=1 Tax=Streptosporangiaceae TaxID=2004 RepID=UPI0033F48B88